MDSFYYDRPAIPNHPCEVKVDDVSIVVSYKWDDEWMNYQGKNLGGGHFELTCEAENGHATLHTLHDSIFLDGYWTANGQKGMWRITLGE
jgi:hypothetical protein